MNTILLICLLAGAPVGACRAEVADYRPYEPPITPSWVTEHWQDFASHIVASEARGVPSADIVVACTLVQDVERGWHPWALGDRWFGYGTPDAADRQAVEDALLTDACDAIPDYKYVGNNRDVLVWLNKGMIKADAAPFDLYVGYHGQTVVGIEWPCPVGKGNFNY